MNYSSYDNTGDPKVLTTKELAWQNSERAVQTVRQWNANVDSVDRKIKRSFFLQGGTYALMGLNLAVIPVAIFVTHNWIVMSLNALAALGGWFVSTTFIDRRKDLREKRVSYEKELGEAQHLLVKAQHMADVASWQEEFDVLAGDRVITHKEYLGKTYVIEQDRDGVYRNVRKTARTDRNGRVLAKSVYSSTRDWAHVEGYEAGTEVAEDSDEPVRPKHAPLDRSTGLLDPTYHCMCGQCELWWKEHLDWTLSHYRAEEEN